MGFKRFVKKHGSQEMGKWVQEFPEAGYRQLKAFAIRNDMPFSIEAELLELHDQYHTRFDGLKYNLHLIWRWFFHG